MALQSNSRLVVSDSGTITEESSILNFKAITIRNENERPEGFDKGVLVMSSLCLNSFKNSVMVGLNTNGQGIVEDYRDKNVSDKVVKIICSYIDYVNSKIWLKR